MLGIKVPNCSLDGAEKDISNIVMLFEHPSGYLVSYDHI